MDAVSRDLIWETKRNLSINIYDGILYDRESTRYESRLFQLKVIGRATLLDADKGSCENKQRWAIVATKRWFFSFITKSIALGNDHRSLGREEMRSSKRKPPNWNMTRLRGEDIRWMEYYFNAVSERLNRE